MGWKSFIMDINMKSQKSQKSAKAKAKAKTGKTNSIAQAATKPTAKSAASKNSHNHKYIFIVGGVMSGVGKGITTSSLGTILQAKGYSVNIAKVDPYLNVDAGTMNPTEHGEVFVMNSGLETDQDMGNYERFMNRDLTNADYMTGGMVYLEVIMRERALKYRGKCVDAVPHIRDEIVNRIRQSGEVAKSDITIIEIGGTVGDYQSAMFYEAARYLKLSTHANAGGGAAGNAGGPGNVLFVMVTYLPVPNKIGEMKSKPTQNAVRELQSYGIQPDFIIGRSEMPIDNRRKEKIAIACNVPMENVISAPDIDSVYDVPNNFERDRFGEQVEKALGLKNRPLDLQPWKNFVQKTRNARSRGKEVNIAIVGKYFDSGDFVLTDAYVSVIEALKFSAYSLGLKPVLHWISAKQFEVDPKTGKSLTPAQIAAALKQTFAKIDGILVPGGFGETGIEGKISVIKYAREHKIPYFGICYGMQLMVIEHARHMAGLPGAQTSEIDPAAPHVVVDIMEHQKKLLNEGKYGASMRLGGFICTLKPDTIAFEAYKKSGWLGRRLDKAVHSIGVSVSKLTKDSILERHRHRYEVNPAYVGRLAESGMVFSGTSPDGSLMEIAELPREVHPFFLGVQFHPEFLARPLDPHPIFTEFIKSSATAKRKAEKKSEKTANMVKGKKIRNKK
jgi:CTP synthase